MGVREKYTRDLLFRGATSYKFYKFLETSKITFKRYKNVVESVGVEWNVCRNDQTTNDLDIRTWNLFLKVFQKMSGYSPMLRLSFERRNRMSFVYWQ